jgi:UDP-glucuronate decarboxylase
MRILVTGGAGFIGSNLCLRLLNEGNYVISLDNFYSSSPLNISDLIMHPNFHSIEGDVVSFDYSTLPWIPDQIYHLACPASPKAYQKNPIYTAKICFIGTLRLLEYIVATGNQSMFLFTSTSEVYGDPLVHPQPESYRGNVNTIGIRSNYDEGKRVAETLVMDFYRVYGVDYRIVRIFNTYGPRMRPDDGRVISNFICQALRNEPITIYGTGLQTRSCCYVTDTVEGLYSLMNQTQVRGPVNIGNPDEKTILQLAQKIVQLIGAESQITHSVLPSDDPKRRCPDITLASNFWRPTIDLDTGLQLTIDYFRISLRGR